MSQASVDTVVEPEAEVVTKARSFDLKPALRDVIIGFADGLTVPFALTASLSSLGSSKLVIIGGVAELVSGAISMGLGAYLATSTDREHYANQREQEGKRLLAAPEDIKGDISRLMADYGVSAEVTKLLADDLRRNKELLLEFKMNFEYRLEQQSTWQAFISALTMGLSYFVGGFIPMIPYFALASVRQALYASIGVTVFILLVFGYIKTIICVGSRWSATKGALQTLMIGMLAAGASYGIVRLIESQHNEFFMLKESATDFVLNELRR